jgi:Kdo2-lipid IVA lauroyltransferase/acyltransferase
MFVTWNKLYTMIKRSFANIGVLFLFLLSLLPLQVLLFFARLLYYLLYYIIGYRKKVVRHNLTCSFPEKSILEIREIEKKYFKFLADLVFEILKMSNISKTEALKRVKFNNIDQINTHLKNGQSVLASTGHYGNWELCTLALGLHIEAKTLVIYKPINNKVFEGWFNDLRTKYGNTFIAMRQTLRAVASYKHEPSLLCFASDQSPARGDSSYFLPFLNQPTAALLGIEKIAKQTNRPIYYFKANVIKRGYYEVDIFPLCMDPSKTAEFEITQLNFDFLERTIKETPQYWLWSHNRWKNKPDLQKQKYQVANKSLEPLSA